MSASVSFITSEGHHVCAFRGCENTALVRVVNHRDLYPHDTCTEHISWAKQRIRKIENS